MEAVGISLRLGNPDPHGGIAAVLPQGARNRGKASRRKRKFSFKIELIRIRLNHCIAGNGNGSLRQTVRRFQGEGGSFFQADQLQRNGIVNAFERVDQRSAQNRRASDIRTDSRIGMNHPDRHREIPFDPIPCPPCAVHFHIPFFRRIGNRFAVQRERPVPAPPRNPEGDGTFPGSLLNFQSAGSIVRIETGKLKLQEAILQLPEKQRLVFNMKYFDEMKYEEMGEILGTSTGALKASYHHATKKIAAYLTESV